MRLPIHPHSHHGTKKQTREPVSGEPTYHRAFLVFTEVHGQFGLDSRVVRVDQKATVGWPTLKRAALFAISSQVINMGASLT